MKRKDLPKRDRLNMRIPRALLAWAKSYVKRKNTSLTQLFIDFLTDLKEKDDESASLPR